MAITLANHKHTSLGDLKMLTGTYTIDNEADSSTTLTVGAGRVYLALFRDDVQGDTANGQEERVIAVNDSVSGGLTTLTIYPQNKSTGATGNFTVIYK